MQEDFHYYATYCAAYLAGYSHEDSLKIGYSAQYVDCCSATLLNKLKAPAAAATTQLQLELLEARMSLLSIQNITRIWSSFHFLPGDLHAKPAKGRGLTYQNKYNLICGTNSDLLVDTVNLAKGKGLQAAGLAMHVLADTWAHTYFAGTPSLVINNTNYQFYEILPEGDRPVIIRNTPAIPDDLENGKYVGSLYQESEQSVMNLGHGRAGHLPDYSFIRYRYMPAWGAGIEIVKDNPSDYMHAFSQMVYAMRYLRGEEDSFEKDRYADDVIAPVKEEIMEILTKRQPNACEDWKRFGEKLSGRIVDEFDYDRYSKEYTEAPEPEKDDTFLGRFILAALEQKSMVTNRIFKSGNLLAGISIDYKVKGYMGIKDFTKLLKNRKELQ